MKFLKWLLLAVFGCSSGFGVAGGVFTSLVAVGLVPRFAGKTHTAEKVFLYEEMVVFGTIVGNICSLFAPFISLQMLVDMVGSNSLFLGNVLSCFQRLLLIVFGIFAGMFVGCLALAIAEMLNSIPIFARRIGFRHGLGIAILFMALGKLAGSLFYFLKETYQYGKYSRKQG